MIFGRRNRLISKFLGFTPFFYSLKSAFKYLWHMTKNLQLLLSFLLIAGAVFWSFYGIQPHAELEENLPEDQFSTARAFTHVEAMAQQPHYVGSAAHRQVRNYIVRELEKMGLLVQTQEAYSLNKYGVITRPQNILTRIEGSGDGKALLLMSHYDSAMHSSPGASDAASGVATILEGIRAYLASGKVPENDIILLFTDAEELGLNGADIFVEEHPWAEDVGLALNFESRGSGGTPVMLLETNSGNEELLQHFVNADVEFPVSTSLYYSVYKMLPNDTDLTVLREQGDINGFNFAFIDDHFDYHTATDTPENLDINTLAHQGAYLMPLLNYFSEIPLVEMASEEELLFFDVPGLGLLTYPYGWIFPLLILAAVLFFGIVIIGIMRKKLSWKAILKGFLPFSIAFFGSILLAYFFWELLLFMYPEYREMEHGFTYNGYYYIGAVIFLSLCICFYTYNWFQKRRNSAEFFIAPLFMWLLISTLMAFYLKGASYFILLVFFGILQLIFMIWRPKFRILGVTLLGLPAVFILMPYIEAFPVALGLKMLFLAALLTTILWMLLWPLFSQFGKKQHFGFLCFLIFMGYFLVAHFNSDFSKERPRPNSLVYIYDEEKDAATWNTYDAALDPYTEPFFGKNAEELAAAETFSSKYNSGFTRTSPAPEIELPEPFVRVEKLPSEDPEIEEYSVKIAPGRDMNRLDLFADWTVDFESFEVNGEEAGLLRPGESDLHIFKHRWDDKLLTYYAVNRDTLRLNIAVEKGINPEITLYEAAYDLHEEPLLNVPERTDAMIPRPFVLNDAIIYRKIFQLK